MSKTCLLIIFDQNINFISIKYVKTQNNKSFCVFVMNHQNETHSRNIAKETAIPRNVSSTSFYNV